VGSNCTKLSRLWLRIATDSDGFRRGVCLLIACSGLDKKILYLGDPGCIEILLVN
jgi:hypothetical protein